MVVFDTLTGLNMAVLQETLYSSDATCRLDIQHRAPRLISNLSPLSLPPYLPLAVLHNADVFIRSKEHSAWFLLTLSHLNVVKGKSVDPDLRQSGCLLYREITHRLFITSTIDSSNQLLGDERNDQCRSSQSLFLPWNPCYAFWPHFCVDHHHHPGQFISLCYINWNK